MREHVHRKQLKYVKRRYRPQNLRRRSPDAIITLHHDVLLERPARKMRGKRHRHNHNHRRKVLPRRLLSLTHVQSKAIRQSRMGAPFPPHLSTHHLLMNENQKERGRIPRRKRERTAAIWIVKEGKSLLCTKRRGVRMTQVTWRVYGTGTVRTLWARQTRKGRNYGKTTRTRIGLTETLSNEERFLTMTSHISQVAAVAVAEPQRHANEIETRNQTEAKTRQEIAIPHILLSGLVIATGAVWILHLHHASRPSASVTDSVSASQIGVPRRPEVSNANFLCLQLSTTLTSARLPPHLG